MKKEECCKNCISSAILYPAIGNYKNKQLICLLFTEEGMGPKRIALNTEEYSLCEMYKEDENNV